MNEIKNKGIKNSSYVPVAPSAAIALSSFSFFLACKASHSFSNCQPLL